MDSDTARTATHEYRKPEVFTLGSVSEFTRWQKEGGSADVWGQQSPDDAIGNAAPGTGTGH